MKRPFLLSLFIILFLLSSIQVFAQIEYPQGLKNEIRCYPHAKILQILDVSGTTMAILQVTDRLSEVKDFYKNELMKKGWKVIMERKMENHFSIIAEKGSKSVVIDAGLNQSGESMINITLTPK